MFDLSGATTQAALFITNALSLIDPSTSIGAVVLVILVMMVLFSVLKSFKRIVPR